MLGYGIKIKAGDRNYFVSKNNGYYNISETHINNPYAIFATKKQAQKAINKNIAGILDYWDKKDISIVPLN